MTASYRWRRRCGTILCRAAIALGVGLAIARGAAAAGVTIACSERGDPERTRALTAVGASVSQLYIVTSDFVWRAPGQPETRRFAAGQSDVSPNLAGRADVHVETLYDTAGDLRLIDFGVLEPDALELAGLRGSLVLHERFLNDRAAGSLFYTASGNIAQVVPLACERFRDP